MKIEWDVDEQINIICSDGSSYKSECVLVTVSLGVLKESHKNLFVPELPPFKQNAIEGFSIGTVDKIFLKFPHRWWPEDCKGFSFVWTEDDRVRLKEEFVHDLSTEDCSWLEDIFGFYTIDSHPQVLMGWVVGEHVGKVEALSDELVLDGCMFLLHKFLANFYDIPEVDDIQR